MMQEGNGISSQPGQERRRFIRLTLEPPLEVKFKLAPLDVSFEAVPVKGAFIKNISIGGGLIFELMLESEEDENKLLSDKMKVRFESGIPGVPSKVRIVGNVIWFRKMNRPGLFYEAGVSFENIKDKIRENILYAMIDLVFKQKKIKT